jgi:DcaP outer membrane protein
MTSHPERKRNHSAWLLLLLFPASWILSVRAVAQGTRQSDVQQLKSKLEQLEQSIKEVKDQINALETQSALENEVASLKTAVPGAPAAPRSLPVASPPLSAAAGTNPATETIRNLEGRPQEPQAENNELPSEHQLQPAPEGTFQLYGHAMLDSGYNFGQIDPNWFDVMRPTKLPSFKNQFGPDGSVYFSVRQNQFGVKTTIPTSLGDLKTWFEFDMFGTGVDAGQTTFRLRQAWGELGQLGAGQSMTPFMDIDVFPNSLEYWGPNGMVFFRNVQFRWTPYKRGDSNFMIAVERPGASADGGVYTGRIELEGVTPQFNLPDFSVHGRFAGEYGHLQIAAMLRKISWVDLDKTPTLNLYGTVFGWGINTSGNLKFDKMDTGRFQVIYGHGVENYMNDAPIDVGVENNLSNPANPLKGVPLPVLGIVAFDDHTWSERFSSTVGYSYANISNSAQELPSDFHQGHYALANLIYYPTKNVLMGSEFQFGRRVNFSDGWNYNDYKLQFSFKYSYSKTVPYTVK